MTCAAVCLAKADKAANPLEETMQYLIPGLMIAIVVGGGLYLISTLRK